MVISTANLIDYDWRDMENVKVVFRPTSPNIPDSKPLTDSMASRLSIAR